MSWQCKLIQFKKDMHPRNGSLKVGDMFYGPFASEFHDDEWGCLLRFYVRHLSSYYKAHNSHRRPLFVVLPGLNLFCVDQKRASDGKRYGGWVVRGEAPNITVFPSITLEGLYHGWIQNGIITPDYDGRLYSADGREIK